MGSGVRVSPSASIDLQALDAGRAGLCGGEFEVACFSVVGEEALAAAEHDRFDHEVELVDEAVGEELLDECGAAVDSRSLPSLALRSWIAASASSAGSSEVFQLMSAGVRVREATCLGRHALQALPWVGRTPERPGSSAISSASGSPPIPCRSTSPLSAVRCEQFEAQSGGGSAQTASARRRSSPRTRCRSPGARFLARASRQRTPRRGLRPCRYVTRQPVSVGSTWTDSAIAAMIGGSTRLPPRTRCAIHNDNPAQRAFRMSVTPRPDRDDGRMRNRQAFTLARPRPLWFSNERGLTEFEKARRERARR